jgi:hypothetical protein
MVEDNGDTKMSKMLTQSLSPNPEFLTQNFKSLETNPEWSKEQSSATHMNTLSYRKLLEMLHRTLYFCD